MYVLGDIAVFWPLCGMRYSFYGKRQGREQGQQVIPRRSAGVRERVCVPPSHPEYMLSNPAVQQNITDMLNDENEE